METDGNAGTRKQQQWGAGNMGGGDVTRLRPLDPREMSGAKKIPSQNPVCLLEGAPLADGHGYPQNPWWGIV